MADYYTNFSLVFTLPSPEAQAYALELASQAEAGRQGDELPEDFPKSLADAVEWWDFETEPSTSEEKPALWIHSSSGGVDALCAFIQHLLEKFEPKANVTFEWSNDCSKPRTDAYGGGAAIVTARDIKTMSTHQWLSEQLALRDQPETKAHVFSLETQCCRQCGRHSDDELVESTPCTTCKP